MPDSDVRMWEAAERAADAAPEIAPGDDVALSLQALFADADFGRPVRQQEPRKPAA